MILSDTVYVRKFGEHIPFTSIDDLIITTPRSDGGGTNTWTWYFYGLKSDGTWEQIVDIQDANGAYTFNYGSAGTYLKMKIILHLDSGDTDALVDGDTILMRYDTSKTLLIYLSKEYLSTADSVTGDITLYVSSCGSTYYDDTLTLGGYRATATGTRQNPYRTIDAANTFVATSVINNICVLDSEKYDEIIEISKDDIFLFSDEGQMPTLCKDIGASRRVGMLSDGNNDNTIYISANGENSTRLSAGTYYDPILTLDYHVNAHFTDSRYDNIVNIVFIDDTIQEATESYWRVSLEVVESAYGVQTTIFQNANTIEFSYIPSIRINNLIFYKKNYYHCIYITEVDNTSVGIYNCSFNGFDIAIRFNDKNNVSGEIAYCYFNNNTNSIVIKSLNDSGIVIYQNIIDNNIHIGIYIDVSGGTSTMTVVNNLIIGGVSNYNTVGIYHTQSDAGATDSTNYYNNTVVDCYYGIYFENTHSVTAAFLELIAYGNTIDLYRTDQQPSITYSCYAVNAPAANDWTIGAGCTTSAPGFIDTVQKMYGIKRTGAAYKTTNSKNNMGINKTFMSIDLYSGLHINGFIIDGNCQNEIGFLKNNINDKTGLIVENCDIKKFTGAGIDLYDDDTAHDAQVLRSKIYLCGTGCIFTRGEVVIEESIFYKNIYAGLDIAQTPYSLDHSVFYENENGIIRDDTVNSLSVINSIFSKNGIGISSNIYTVLIYCIVNDYFSATVDTSHESNILGQPAFINVDDDTEDFHLKKIANGYTYNSVGLEAAQDGYDIGAYLETYAQTEEWWKHYQLAYNPRLIKFGNSLKGYTAYENIAGASKDWYKDTKREFIFQYAPNQYSAEADRKKLEYLATILQSIANGHTEDESIVRFSPLPEQGLYSGTGTVSGKTIIDGSAIWNENEHKGYSIGIKFLSGTNIITTLTGGVATKTGAFTGVDYTGYYLYINSRFYWIKSNDANNLYLSDPDSTLNDETVAVWSVEKYFKVEKNTSNTLYLGDDNNELIEDSYDYIIRFIECKILNGNFTYIQPRYYWQKETWKTGYQILLEEV